MWYAYQVDKSLIGGKLMKFAAKTISLFTVLLTGTTLFAAEPAAMNDDQKTLYAIGHSVSRSLAVFEFTPAEFDVVKQGLSDAQAGKKEVDLTAYNSKIQDLAKARRKAAGERLAGAGKEFLENAAKEKGAVKTASGMVYTSMVEGKGASPKSTDVVKVDDRATLIDGKEFDSSYKRGKPLEFKLDKVIKCWIEGVQLMKIGGKAKMVCPSELAYGDKGAGEMILPGAALVFEVELLEINPAAVAKPSSGKPLTAVPPVPKEPAKK